MQKLVDVVHQLYRPKSSRFRRLTTATQTSCMLRSEHPGAHVILTKAALNRNLPAVDSQRSTLLEDHLIGMSCSLTMLGPQKQFVP